MYYYKIFLASGRIYHAALPGDLTDKVTDGIRGCIIEIRSVTNSNDIDVVHVRPVRIATPDPIIETDDDEFLHQYRGKGVYAWFAYGEPAIYATSDFIVRLILKSSHFLKTIFDTDVVYKETALEELVRKDPFSKKAHLN